MPSTGGVKVGSSYDEARTRKMNAEAEVAEEALEKAPSLSDDAHFEIHEDSKILSVEEAGERDAKH